MRILLLLLINLVLTQNTFGQTVSEFIHVDQFGYLPDADKVCVISNPINGYNGSESYNAGTTFQIIDTNTMISVYSAAPSQWNSGNTHGQSGDQGWWFDFSSVTTPGTYYILDVDNDTKSYTFEIQEDVYLDVLKSSTKMFYYNRCNAPKEAPYADANWVDGTNFHNAQQDSFCRDYFDQSNPNSAKDLSGGWWDAGDYNKYVTFAAKPIHQLLYAYEESTAIFTDDWNIPESNNGIPDLIDEIIWELDWLQKMANPDGSVILKMGSIDFSDNIAIPPSANTDPRYYGPTCSSASIAAAGMFAHSALVLGEIPGLEIYADTLESIAEDCYGYGLNLFDMNQLETTCDNGEIKAGDADWDIATQRKKLLLAAVYLWELTGDVSYHNHIINNINDVEFISNNWLGNGTNDELEALLHYSTLAGADQTTIDEITNSITPHISQDWNSFFGMNDDDLYRSYIPDWAYHWGSNQPKADFAILNRIIKNYNLNPADNDSYEEKAAQHVHYFHGINPQNMVYLSNMYDFGGDHCANEIYHTWFADGSDYDNALTSLYGPAPGFVSGGPNKDFTISTISPPYNQPPQKSYLDFNDGSPNNSWEITEPAIYYQAVYIRLLAAYANDPCAGSEKIFIDHMATGSDNGTSWANAFTSLSDALGSDCIGNTDTIFMAKGTYIPSTMDREDSYILEHNIVIKGGYNNGGSSYDPNIHQVSLSGNIGNISIDSDNLYHVLEINNSESTVSLINLTIQNGYANGSGDNSKGAAIFSIGNLTLENVQVSQNAGFNDNEGIYIMNPGTMTVVGDLSITSNIKL